MYKNSEGYADPTAGSAMSQIMKEYRQKQKKRYADKNRRKMAFCSDLRFSGCAMRCGCSVLYRRVSHRRSRKPSG